MEKTMFRWGVHSLTFSGGEEIFVDQDSVLIITGPNNSGKTLALQEIEQVVVGGMLNNRVITNGSKFCEGTLGDFITWMEERYPVRAFADAKYFINKGVILSEAQLPDIFAVLQTGQGYYSPGNYLNNLILERLDTSSRLSLVSPAQLSNPYVGSATHYIHVLQADDRLMKIVSNEFYRAFGEHLVINWYGGGNNLVHFHIGQEPERTVEKDRVSAAYQAELIKLPLLHEAGDGVRSFVGTLLAIHCGRHPVLLIDEPEAFLHPKQAERLGAILARSAETLHRQIIISTHSSAIIRGAINTSNKVSICRLTRHNQGSMNHATLLSSEEVKQLWSSPLLRSTAAIEGVFNTGVVVCEADTDVRFYETLLQQLEETGRLDGPGDLHFVHGNGKGKLATLANTYKRLNISVAVIADLDLLRNDAEFKAVLRALGIEFDSVAHLYKQTLVALNDVSPRRSVQDFVQEADVILSRVRNTSKVDNTDRRRLAEILDDTARWSEAKRYGINKLRGGELQAAKELLRACQAVGLFLVPTGELESWWPAGPAEKKEWLLPAIERITAGDPDLDSALAFMYDIYTYISGT